MIKNTLFLDIETVPVAASFEALDDNFKEFWRKKSKYWIGDSDNINEELYAEKYEEKAGIYAEFAKVVCISAGLLVPKDDDMHMRIKSFYGHDEKELLEEFAGLLNEHYNNPLKHKLCGHNIKEFDIPFISRRMVINGIKLPAVLDNAGKKPWETKHLCDTMEMWKFGDYKNFTSLDLLAAVLGIESPKDDIDGSMVGKVYWETQDLERIKTYCEKDVLTTAKVYLKLNNIDYNEFFLTTK